MGTAGPTVVAGAEAGSIQPPYGVIARALKQGKVVPFLGAGASLLGPPCPPSAWHLANQLAEQVEFPDDDRDNLDLAKVCSYYVDAASREDLRAALREILQGPFPSGPLHELLAKVPSPMVVVTTNYDRLVEQAYEAAGKPYDLVVYPTESKIFCGALWLPHGEKVPRETAANELNIDLSTRNVIYKMHGTIWPPDAQGDNFVITEEDYVEFLSRMTENKAIPSLFFPYFAQRRFLFLGYGLRDWNLRVLLSNLNKRISGAAGGGGGLRSWAIQRNPSPLDRSLWNSRGVKIFDVDLKQFVERLAQDMTP